MRRPLAPSEPGTAKAQRPDERGETPEHQPTTASGEGSQKGASSDPPPTAAEASLSQDAAPYQIAQAQALLSQAMPFI